MDQLILGGVRMPQTSFDKYSCWEEPLTRNQVMVSGRWTLERIGTRYMVWRMRTAYDYIEDEIYRPALAVLRSGGPIIATVLPDNSDETVTSSFVVDSITQPSFLIDDNDRAVWHGLAFSLREEYPHA